MMVGPHPGRWHARAKMGRAESDRWHLPVEIMTDLGNNKHWNRFHGEWQVKQTGRLKGATPFNPHTGRLGPLRSIW